MKKVGIITIHSAHNYGAMLQAYALQQAIKKTGCDSQFIDYVPKAESQDKSLFISPFSMNGIIHNIRTLLNYSKRKRRYDLFEQFLEENMILTSTHYCNTKGIKQIKEQFDIYITGSDQTFNLRLRGDSKAREPYYLNFVKEGIKLSYAASFGENINELTDENKKFIKEELGKYRGIGIREESGRKFLQEECNVTSQVVLDPTLLLDKKDWECIGLEKREKIPAEYILFYTVLSDAWAVQQVERLAKLINLPVIALHLKNRYELHSDFIRKFDSGPREFIWYIKNASIVVTTSFHATVFSIIFKKKFWSLRYGVGARIGMLVSQLGLTERLVQYGKDIDINSEIDYEVCDEKLPQLIEESYDFLEKSLNEG